MHNVGAIFRTADAFRVDKIYLCGITATPPHRDIRKTALGAEESVSWEYMKSTKDALSRIENADIYALEQADETTALRDVVLDQSKTQVLILGNEVEGVQQELLDYCKEVIEIPQFGTKHSFNVSVSAGIAMWELFNKINA